MRKAIHETTAQICKDIEEPPQDLELIDPHPFRRCTRLLVIFIIGAFLVAAIVVMALRIPEFQEDKTPIPSKHHNLATVLTTAFQKNQTVNCPCQSQILSWCTITTFYIYVQGASSSIPDEMSITGANGLHYLEDLCKSNDSLGYKICVQTLSPVLDYKDSRTFLPTANAFTHPELLYTEISTRIETNAYEQTSANNFLESMDKTQDLLHYSQGLIELVRDMSTQFDKKSSSSKEDFWKASAKTRQNSSLRFGFGMNVSWEKYLENCKAAFCDIQFKVSVMNRVLRAMGQVGGITTVISLALKFLIWPSLRIALRFPTTKQTI